MTFLPPGIATPPPGVPGSGPTVATPPGGGGPGVMGSDPGVEATATGPTAFGDLTGALAPLKSLSDLVGLLGGAAAWIGNPHNWIRLLQIVLGSVGLFVGLSLVSQDLQQIEKGAAMAAAL